MLMGFLTGWIPLLLLDKVNLKEVQMNMPDSRNEPEVGLKKLNRVIKDLKQFTSSTKRSSIKHDHASNPNMSVLPPLSVIRNLDRYRINNLFQELTPKMCLVHYDPFRFNGSTFTSPYGILKERSRSNRCDSGISLWDQCSPRETKNLLR